MIIHLSFFIVLNFWLCGPSHHMLSPFDSITYFHFLFNLIVAGPQTSGINSISVLRFSNPLICISVLKLREKRLFFWHNYSCDPLDRRPKPESQFFAFSFLFLFCLVSFIDMAQSSTCQYAVLWTLEHACTSMKNSFALYIYFTQLFRL